MLSAAFARIKPQPSGCRESTLTGRGGPAL